MQILSFNPEDNAFFIGLSMEEFEQLASEHDIEYEIPYNYEQTKQNAFKNLSRANYTKMINEAYSIQSTPFICVAVSRDTSKIAVRPSHFPFASLWNGYSPWIAFPVQEIDSLEVLKNIKTDV